MKLDRYKLMYARVGPSVGQGLRVGVVAALFLTVIAVIEILPVVPYDPENYRSTFGVAAGALATVFAFIAGTATLLMQQVASNSPTSLNFFPLRQTLAFLGLLVGVLSADGAILLLLPTSLGASSPTWYLTGINTALMLNLLACFGVVGYVRLVWKWLKPTTVIDALVRRVPDASRAEDLELILQSLDEIFSSAVDKRYSTTTAAILEAHSRIAAMLQFPPNMTEEAGHAAYHRFEMVLMAATHSAKILVRADMEIPLQQIGHVFMTFILCGGRAPGSFASHSVAFSIKDVAEECVKRASDTTVINMLRSLTASVGEGPHVGVIADSVAGVLNVALESTPPRTEIIAFALMTLEHFVRTRANGLVCMTAEMAHNRVSQVPGIHKAGQLKTIEQRLKALETALKYYTP